MNERTADTGLVGMWIFLGSTTVLFAALTFSYAMLRVQGPPWSAVLPVGRALVSTAVLVGSSALLSAGQGRLARAQPGGAACLAGALAAGLAFLVLQVLLLLAFRPAGGGLARSVVLLLAGVHAAHVIAGLLALAVASAPFFVRPPAARALTRLRLTAMFWHFVDLCWIALFVALFIL